MTIKTIIVIVAVGMLIVGVCSGPKGVPTPDREKNKVDHLLRGVRDEHYYVTHDSKATQKDKNRVRNNIINGKYNNKKK